MYSPSFGTSSSQNQNVVSLRPGQPPALPPNATPELKFAVAKMAMTGYGELALGGLTEDGDIDTTIYEWNDDANGARWKLLPIKKLEGEAANWTKIYTPDHTTGGKSKSCVQTLQNLMVHDCRYMPKHKGLNLVPFKNAYLVIENDGTIRCVRPDPSYGVDYIVDTSLDLRRVNKETGEYAPEEMAESGLWNRYITSTLPDPEVREFAQEALSTVLLTRCYEKGIWLYGEGENGKSVMLHLLRKVAPMHTAAVKLSRLVKNEFGTAQLNNKRIALVSEMPSRLNRDMQTVLKGFISRDPTPCERKGRDEFTFTPSAVWIFATNHHPDMSEHEHGFWRKIETLPFVDRVAKENKILDLHEKIANDPVAMRQFINWLLVGAARLSKRGRWRSDEEKPEAVRNLALAQRRETDTVAGWLADCEMRYDAKALTRKGSIYVAYRDHVSDGGRHPLSDGKFWSRIKEHYRDWGLDTEGQQRTINGKRQRCVNLVLEGVKVEAFASPLDEKDVFPPGPAA